MFTNFLLIVIIVLLIVILFSRRQNKTELANINEMISKIAKRFEPVNTSAPISKEEMDELINKAKEMIITNQKASTVYLQRKFGIGYARAATILDKLEEQGIIGPMNGAQPRKILVKK